MPSPDRTCSPAVTRWKKAKELVKQTPEVLRKARLEKQMKIAQKGNMTLKFVRVITYHKPNISSLDAF